MRIRQCSGTKTVRCPDCGLTEPCFATHLKGSHRNTARCYECAVKRRDANEAARANVVPARHRADEEPRY